MLAAADKIEPIYVAIGERILEERSRAGWTQQDLCGQVGLARASVANIELGRQRIMLHQVIAFADALSVPVGDLIGVGVDATRDSTGKGELRAEIVALRKRVAGLEATLRAVAAKALSEVGE